MTQDFESEIRKGNNSSLGGLMVSEGNEWVSLASSLSTPLLVPLRTKFHSANPKELPGWRGERPAQPQDEESNLSIRSRSPPFVNSKREWNASPMYPRHEKSRRLLEVPLLLPKIKSKPELIVLRPFSHEMRGVDEDFASKTPTPFDIKTQELRKTQHSALETLSTLEATLPPIKNPSYGFTLKRPSSKGVISLEINEEKDPIIYTESIGIQNLGIGNEERKLQFTQNSIGNSSKMQFSQNPSSKTEFSTGKNEIKRSQKLSYGTIPEDEEQSPTPYSQPDLKLISSSNQGHQIPYSDNPRLLEIYKHSPELKLDKNTKVRKNSDSQTTFRKNEAEEFKQEMFKELFFAAPTDRKSSAKLTPSNKKTLLHTFLKALITGEIRNRAQAQEFIDNELSKGVVIVKQSRGSSSSGTRFVLSPSSEKDRSLSPERSQNIIIQPHQSTEIDDISIKESPRKNIIKTPTKSETIIPASVLKLKPNFADLNKIEYENEEESDSEIDININSSFHNEIQNNSLEERQPSPQHRRQRSSSFSGKKDRENSNKILNDEITLIPSVEREEKISPRQEESLIQKARKLREKWAEEDRKKTIPKEIHKENEKEEYEEVEEKEITYDNETGEMIEKIIIKARLRREKTKQEEEKKIEDKRIAEEEKKEKAKLEFLEAPNHDIGRAKSEFLSPKRKESFNAAPDRRNSADIRTDIKTGIKEIKPHKNPKKIKKSSKSPADSSLSKSPPLSRVPSLKKTPSSSKAPSPMPPSKSKKNKKKNKKQKQIINKEQIEKENEEDKALISEWSENIEVQPLQLNEKNDKDESPTLEGEAPKTNRSKKSMESQKTVKSEKGDTSPRKTDSKARISRDSAKNTGKAGSSSPSPARNARTPLDETGSPITKEKRKTIIRKSDSPPKDTKPTPRIKPIDRFVRNFSKSLLQTVSIMVITLKNELQKAEPLLENVDPYEIVARRKKITRKINKIRKKTRIELEKQIVLREEEINESPPVEERKTENKLEEVNEDDKEQEQAELVKAKSYAPERSSTFKELNDSHKASEAPPRMEKEKSNFGISNASKYFSKALLSKVPVSHSSTKNRIVSESETEESGTEQDESEGSLGPDTARLEIVSSKPLNVAYDRARASANYELQNFNLVSQMAKHILAGTEEPSKPQILAQPAVSEFFKRLVPSDTTHKTRGPVKVDPANAQEEEEELEEEPVDTYANTLDVDEELLSMFTGKTTNIKKFVFTPQVQFKFPQKFDANQETDVNDIELANFNIDQENFEASMLKKRFFELSKFLPTYDAYSKKQNGVLFSSEIEEQHPDEAQMKRIRDFEKKRKKERILRMRGKNKPVELGGKPKKTFTNLDDNGQQHKRKNVKHIPNLITDIDIIKSGGANEVEDEMDREERIYCRLKGNFELNSLKLPQKRNYKGSKSVRSLVSFSTFQSDRSSKHYKTGFIL